jgi:hypothetical protein
MHHWAVIVLAGWVMWIETIASLEPGVPRSEPWTIHRRYDRHEDCVEDLRIQQQRITQEAVEVTPRDDGFVARRQQEPFVHLTVLCLPDTIDPSRPTP